MYHVNVMRSHHVLLEGLNVSVSLRPATSAPNTDGLNIGPQSSQVTIRDCRVTSGDDNLVIKNGCQGVVAARLTFEQGKGIAIGSLGERESYGLVGDCHFSNITMAGTLFGARIKTWAGGRGIVRNITFQDLRLSGVGTALVLDQNYCPPSQAPEGCEGKLERINISDVRVSNLSGTVGTASVQSDCK